MKNIKLILIIVILIIVSIFAISNFNSRADTLKVNKDVVIARMPTFCITASEIRQAITFKGSHGTLKGIILK